MKFSIKDFFSKCHKSVETVDLVRFTEEILKEKPHFSTLCPLMNNKAEIKIKLHSKNKKLTMAWKNSKK